MNPILTGTFRWFFDQLSAPITNALGQLTVALQGWVGPKFKICVLAYFLATLLIAAWSADETAFHKFFRQLFLASIIYSLAVTAADFNHYITGGFDGIINGVSTAISGIFGAVAPGANTADLFDKIGVKSLAVGVATFKSLQWYSPKAWILGLCIVAYWILTIGTLIVPFVIYLSSLLVTKFVIAFGPLFIVCRFFPFTRFLFDGWLGVVMGGVLTQILTVGWVAVFNLVMTTNLARIQAGISTNADDVVGLVMAMLLAWALTAIFASMTSICALVAVRIASGAHTIIEGGRGGGSTPSLGPPPPVYHGPPPAAEATAAPPPGQPPRSVGAVI